MYNERVEYNNLGKVENKSFRTSLHLQLKTLNEALELVFGYFTAVW